MRLGNVFSVLSTLSFIKLYIEELDAKIAQVNANYKLTTAQRIWLGFVLSCILVTNSFCWAVFSRASHAKHKESKLSWFFKFAKLPWNKLLALSVGLMLKRYNITQGVLVIDDSNIKRSKNTSKLYGLQKLKDKSTGGFLKGQNLVLLLLVTDKVTIPVGFDFYVPDPTWLVWKDTDTLLRKQGIAKSKRPIEPQKSVNFPSKLMIAVNLVKAFKVHHPEVKIKALLADCFFGNKNFTNGIKDLNPKLQVIS